MLDAECKVEISPCFLGNAFTLSDLDTFDLWFDKSFDLCETNSCKKA